MLDRVVLLSPSGPAVLTAHWTRLVGTAVDLSLSSTVIDDLSSAVHRGEWVTEQGLTSAPTQYRLSGRQFYRSKDPTNSIKVLKENATKTKDNPEKANNTKYSQTKLAWFGRLIRPSTRKRDGLILQRSRAQSPHGAPEVNGRLRLRLFQRQRSAHLCHRRRNRVGRVGQVLHGFWGV